MFEELARRNLAAVRLTRNRDIIEKCLVKDIKQYVREKHRLSNELHHLSSPVCHALPKFMIPSRAFRRFRHTFGPGELINFAVQTASGPLAAVASAAWIVGTGKIEMNFICYH